ncbi:hypothetical protein [Ideonella sp.]|nr:MAG: hypothetical protein C4K60_00725 [Ideonella sp. MAG2]
MRCAVCNETTLSGRQCATA